MRGSDGGGRPEPWRDLARTLAAAIAMAWRAGRFSLIGQVAAAAALGLVPVIAAWLLRTVIDVLAGTHARADLILLAVLMGVAGAVTALLPNMTQFLAAQSQLGIQRQATADLFAGVTRLAGLRRLEDPQFRDRLRLAEQAGQAGPGQVVSGTITVVQSALTLSGFLITLLVLNPVMAAVAVAAAIPAIYLERGIARQQVALMHRVAHGERRQFFYEQLLSGLDAAKEIRLFGLGPFLHTRMLAELAEVQRATGRVNRKVLAGNTLIAAIGALVAAAGLLWAVLAAAAGRMTVGDVTVFVTALGSVVTALGTLITTAALSYQALLMFAAYRQVLAQDSDLATCTEPVPAAPLQRGIELRDVWFRYGPDTPWILRGVNCFIPRGQALAIVGHNGAGKSTLVKLLCRFYDPDRGSILWDGTDLRDMDVSRLRERISAVFQDYVIYDLSAAENIGLGDLTQASHTEALIAAAQRAGIHESLAALPRGYQTLLTRTFFDVADKDDPQTGVLLSGGQGQRVAVARAFLRGARDLMILDEPSSGLDAEAEHEIHKSLAEHRRGRATVLISHRLNTIRDAEHIVVLADGVISEQGDHDALMAQGGTYARLFSLQARGYSDELSPVGSGNG